jgi:exodeoxyribonuclease-3
MRTIATWNVNSLRVRLPQMGEWLASNPVHTLALQETKLEDSAFPRAEIEALGFEAAFSGQRTYNGVAILARAPISDVVADIPGFGDPQRRVLAATIDGVRVVNLYVPNGQSVGSDKYEYKLRWLGALRDWLAYEVAHHPKIVVLGDFNIAPDDRDVHDPAAWAGSVLVSDAERAALQAVTALGLKDSFRLFDQPAGSYSWWDYRQGAFRRNNGLRIDLLLVSEALAACCTRSAVDREPRRAERPSDHAPALASFDI